MPKKISLKYACLGAVMTLTCLQCEWPGHRDPFLALNGSQADWSSQEGRLFLGEKPYTGYQFELYTPQDTAELLFYKEGLSEGVARYWYPDGRIREKRFFKNGKREGVHYGWWENGQKSFEYHFEADLHQGMAYTWHPNGQMASAFHYEKGQEVGPQKAWDADGQLRLNYVVRNGRQYGLTGVKNCTSVWDASLGKFQVKPE